MSISRKVFKIRLKYVFASNYRFSPRFYFISPHCPCSLRLYSLVPCNSIYIPILLFKNTIFKRHHLFDLFFGRNQPWLVCCISLCYAFNMRLTVRPVHSINPPRAYFGNGYFENYESIASIRWMITIELIAVVLCSRISTADSRRSRRVRVLPF